MVKWCYFCSERFLLQHVNPLLKLLQRWKCRTPFGGSLSQIAYPKCLRVLLPSSNMKRAGAGYALYGTEPLIWCNKQAARDHRDV